MSLPPPPSLSAATASALVFEFGESPLVTTTELTGSASVMRG